MTPQAALDGILHAYSRGCYDQAAERATAFTSRFPQIAIGWTLLGASRRALGHPQDAATAFRRAVALSPRDAEAHSNLGAVLLDLNLRQDAVSCLRKATGLRPDFAAAWRNLGQALEGIQDWSQAEAAYRQCLALTPDDLEVCLWLGNLLTTQDRPEAAETVFRHGCDRHPQQPELAFNLGNALKKQGRLSEATAAYRQAVQLRPDYAQAWNNLGNTLADLECWRDAADAYRRVIASNPDQAPAWEALGHALQRLDDFEQAADAFSHAHALRPEDRDIALCWGKILGKLHRHAAAEAAFRTALSNDPDHAETQRHLAYALLSQGNFEEAETAFNTAIALAPGDPTETAHRLDFLERSNRLEELRRELAYAPEPALKHPHVALVQARLEKRDGRLTKARDQLIALGPEVALPLAQERASQLGDVCDRLGDTDAAFSAYLEANRLALQEGGASRHDKDRYLNRIEQLSQQFTADWVAGWHQLTRPTGDRRAPVFLVGFPRSGTTLLDTVLRSHPAVVVVEESPAVARLIDILAKSSLGYPGSLAHLNDEAIAKLRTAYFETLDQHADDTEPDDYSAIIDKLPLNSVEAGLIHRVFPEARFILALRHPCDCVLSCVMHSFQLNDAMANFLDLNAAAHLYDRVMTLWEQYRALLPLPVHTVHYETLVIDFETTVCGLLDFLGLRWHDSVTAYADTARARKRINTPSYAQVTEPLYTRASGRWTRYHKQMAPVMPVLRPWAERFGYAIE